MTDNLAFPGSGKKTDDGRAALQGRRWRWQRPPELIQQRMADKSYRNMVFAVKRGFKRQNYRDVIHQTAIFVTLPDRHAQICGLI